ncbi:hypothetical protein EZJ49_09270 [Bdellovibrio bacteriovorus]|uniref:hypothetical protein n=1 Tax=Bdellovibrio bacteriovorus TaxID=959 RepID=UPI0021CEEE74|nr:hypothetical protein [Bdellovibrio bacteriovorus]UXR63268.1 hypothetical protein EZJ49_09270 [Bdellovibrio bacteriovorus]
MKLLVNSLFLIAGIPLIALALEPTNPSGLCDRFTGEKDITECQKKTEKENADWYATTVCNLQQDDKAFWACWDSIQGQSFRPQALQKCGEAQDMTDSQRQTCLDSSKQGRAPASADNAAGFQPLKIKGK